MDSGDKGANKAMSAAHKYALVQALCMATDEKIDTENETPVATTQAEKPAVSAPQKKFAFRKPADAPPQKASSFHNVLPTLKMAYFEVFGKYDKYWLQLLANRKVATPDAITGSDAQAEFLEGVEKFVAHSKELILAQSSGRTGKFSELGEADRAVVLSNLDKIALLA
jgi:hypothetical protein